MPNFGQASPGSDGIPDWQERLAEQDCVALLLKNSPCAKLLDRHQSLQKASRVPFGHPHSTGKTP